MVVSASGFKTKRRKYIFIQQIIKLWKSLTRMLWVFIQGINGFKKQLDNFLDEDFSKAINHCDVNTTL